MSEKWKWGHYLLLGLFFKKHFYLLYLFFYFVNLHPRIFLHWFLKRVEETEKEKHQSETQQLVVSTGLINPACNRSMCPWLELNSRPFYPQANSLHWAIPDRILSGFTNILTLSWLKKNLGEIYWSYFPCIGARTITEECLTPINYTANTSWEIK